MVKHYDLLVVGGGSGGLSVARRSAKYGVKVALIDMGELGGTCVNLGCIPKKIMWNAAELASFSQIAKDYGFEYRDIQLDFNKLVLRREQFIESLNQIYEHHLKNDKVDFIKGCAKFSDPHTLIVNDTKTYSAEHVVIATGCTPKRLGVRGEELCINSDGFFNLKEQPKNVAIIGAGYIAVELTSILNQLGSKVKLLLRHDKPIREFDYMLSDAVFSVMQARGVEILTFHTTKEIICDQHNQLTIHCNDNKSVTDLDCIIYAIGRTPRIHDLNLNAAGVRTDENGFIMTDKWEKTNIAHICAIGDVTGKKLLTPTAIAAGIRLAKRLFGNEPVFFDYENVPTVVFHHPPVGSIGLSEQEAVRKYGKNQIDTHHKQYSSLYYALSDNKIPTQMKLITLKNSGKIIGCHLICREADEILQGYAVAIKMGATLNDLRNTVAIHPTNAEELLTS